MNFLRIGVVVVVVAAIFNKTTFWLRQWPKLAVEASAIAGGPLSMFVCMCCMCIYWLCFGEKELK